MKPSQSICNVQEKHFMDVTADYVRVRNRRYCGKPISSYVVIIKTCLHDSLVSALLEQKLFTLALFIPISMIDCFEVKWSSSVSFGNQ